MGRGADDKYYWLEVTRDKYQLPLAVADTREELAELRGIKPRYISENMNKFKRGIAKQRFIKVKK